MAEAPEAGPTAPGALWPNGRGCAEVAAREALTRAAAADRHEWIHRLPEADVLLRARALDAEAEALGDEGRRRLLPLLGTTFAVKDNIAVAGVPLTNGCDYTSGGAPVPEESAAAVGLILAAGAVLIGKTNLDCAATGLVGVRSAYGACQNAFDKLFISGGSSSGSAVVVATGQVSFSLGTDTAGSGRVPAMLNNLVGLKASRGLISTHGVVPACRSLDCVSVFASTVAEAWAVFRVAAGAAGDDPWDRAASALCMGPRLPATGPARFCFAVPSKEHLDFGSFGAAQQERAPGFEAAWASSVEALKAIGGTCVEVDYTPFQQTAKLLYEGPWVAERYSALKDLLKSNAQAVHPTVRSIVEPAGSLTAMQAFEAFYRLQELRAAAERAMKACGAQVLVTPTAGATYTIEQVQADPVALNSHMGRYTNHMNLLDLCGIAVPTTLACGKFPFGVTISAAAGHDALICDIAARVHEASGLRAGATSSPVREVAAVAAARLGAGLPSAPLQSVDMYQIAVSGAHMEGLPLSSQLTERGGRFVRRAKTAPVYRLLAFEGMQPPRPGLRDAGPAEAGAAVDLEVWELPAAALGGFLRLVAAPLGIGWVQLEGGERVQGFRLVDAGVDRCGGRGREPPVDITRFGGWRRFLEEAALPAEKRSRLA